MRVLVIGGTGFIGLFVSRLLVREGASVTVMHRGRKKIATLIPGARSLVIGQLLSSPAALEPGLATGPDVVVHLLAMREAEALATLQTFSGKVERLVFASSGDVYRAYGLFIKQEPGNIEPVPLVAGSSPLRSKLYPYRGKQTPRDSLEYDYEKILVERVLMGEPRLRATCLRLPKVYGKDKNEFESVYRFAKYPNWRWTHGYVENVAAAIALACCHPTAGGKTYNVGEAATPSVGERLALLPPSPLSAPFDDSHDFGQDIVYDTLPIRQELGYREPVSWEESIERTLGGKGSEK